MNASFTLRRISSVVSAATLATALLVCVSATHAGNIAGTGTGFIGSTSNPLLTGTENDHSGSVTAINDNNLGTHIDNFGGGNNANSYTGISFASPVSIQSVGLTMAMFVDGGWFGPGGTGPAHGGTLTAAELTAPTVQVTTDGVNWTNVASTNNYVSVMTGATIGADAGPNPNNSPLSTFNFGAENNITGVRLLGPGGGVANGGFIGIAELTVTATPEPSTFVLGGLGLIGLVVAARRRRG